MNTTATTRSENNHLNTDLNDYMHVYVCVGACGPAHICPFMVNRALYKCYKLFADENYKDYICNTCYLSGEINTTMCTIIYYPYRTVPATTLFYW